MVKKLEERLFRLTKESQSAARDLAEEVDALPGRVDELLDRVEELEAAVEEKDGEIESLKVRLADAMAQLAAVRPGTKSAA